MNTKTCKNCGWVYPITQPGRRCLICGELFDIVICTVCGEPTPKEEISGRTLWCKACTNARDANAKAQHRQELVDEFDVWIGKIKSVPKDYPTLTEQQWLEACVFFDGCARCHSDEIDARGFFVGAKLGGRYCDWNIIPLCEKCAVNWNLTKSAFIYTETRDHNKGGSEYRECLAKIKKYLGGKLDDATRYKAVPNKHTSGM